MNELLSNPAVQAALVVVIVTVLNGLVAWLKQKFPTQAASIDANWSYIHPIVDTAMAKAQSAVEKRTGGASVMLQIAAQGVADFCDSYNRFEGKPPTTAEIKAARTEIENALARVTGG